MAAPFKPPPTPPVDPLGGHKAESERLGKLVEFLRDFGPAPGESRQPGRGVDADIPAGLLRARDRAIAESFRAVERIARASFNFPKPKREPP